MDNFLKLIVEMWRLRQEKFKGQVVINFDGDTVSRIDPDTLTVTDTISVGDTPAEMAVSDDAVWVANFADGTVSRIG